MPRDFLLLKVFCPLFSIHPYQCYFISFILLGRFMANVSNQQVVQELREGNRLGCKHLIDLYQDRLIGEAVHLFHIPLPDAEELASDVLLTVVNKIHSFEFKKGDTDFHYWIMTIFRNRIRDFVRHRALTDGLMEYFQESAFEENDEYSSTEREVVAAIVRDYEESLRLPDEEKPADDKDSVSGKLQVIAETLEGMETWERVLLRCRALDVPYEEIARYTGKTAKQLKVYHARVKKRFMKLLAQHYPELTIP